MVCEAMRLNECLQRDFSFSDLANQGGADVDLIVERPASKTVFIEIKSTEHVRSVHLRHFRDLSDGQKNLEAICLSQETRARKDGEVLILPWREGFKYTERRINFRFLRLRP
jgi:hypothetical protein